MAGRTGRGARLVVLGGVLLALLVAGGVVLVNRGGDEEPTGGGGGSDGPAEADGELEALWRTAPADAGDPGLGDEVRRVWASDRVVVLLTNAGVWGYDPETGEELWQRELPEDRSLVGAVDEAPLVLHEASADDGYPHLSVARLDPADGTERREGLLPQDAEDGFRYVTSVLGRAERALYPMEANAAAGTVRLVAVRR